MICFPSFFRAAAVPKIAKLYLHAKHKETYGIPYVTNNRGMEAKNLKLMIDEQGAEVTRRFIDKCFAEKKPTLKYPGCNFAFMFSYMREYSRFGS